MDFADVCPPDIIFHIVRQLVSDLKDAGFGFGWTKFTEFFSEINDILNTEVEFKSLKVGGPLEFGVALKDVPGARKNLRKLLEDRLPTIYNLINETILKKAREWLKEEGGYEDILIVVDQLDRIPQKALTDRLTNHENTFLDHAGTLRALSCDVLYTIPIELAYSRCRARLEDVYGTRILTLPVIPVSERGRRDFAPGLRALCEIVRRRADKAGVSLDSFFTDRTLLERLCRLSGGHVRTLFILLRSAIERSDALPITEDIVQRAVRRSATISPCR